jgi:hypothetical protein
MHFRLRSFQRENAGSEIAVTGRDFSLTSSLANISMGGLFIHSNGQTAVTIGKLVKLRFLLPSGSEDTSFNVNGMAVRICPDGIAFRFIETEPDTLRALFSFVYEKNSGVSC